MKILHFSGLLFFIISCTQSSNKGIDLPYHIQDTLYYETFDQPDTSSWIAESENNFNFSKAVANGALDINVTGGITLWHKRKFEGNVIFEFEVTVIDKGGKNDRVSDLNCFWMATDPQFPHDFFKRSTWRKGIFHRYYSLNLYYVGYGGHNNTKTRFRKYNGISDPIPVILQEYTDRQHLIVPNKRHVIRIVCLNQLTQYFFNNEKLFELDNPQPFKEGYFGFRTTDNHMRIESFNVYSLK